MPPRIVALALTFLITQPTIAQIIPDGTTNTTLTPEANLDRISGQPLTPNATNLLHSFEQFSIQAGHTAQFQLPNDTITTILTRITGTEPSQIDGTLIVDGTADLFFLNPNGISFGRDSRVNLGGDLILTTADRIQFGDNLSFSATDTTTDTTLLSVLVPTGLQFGNNPGAIVNRSQTFGQSDNPRLNVNSVNAPLGIHVLEDRALLVAGGDITIEGGHFSAIGGTISLASSGSDRHLGLTRPGTRWRLSDFPEPLAGGTISLSDNAIVDASGRLIRTFGEGDLGGGGGDLQLFARNLSIRNGGITTSSYGLPGNTLTVLTEDLSIRGTVQTPIGEVASGIFNQSEGLANGGDLDLSSHTIRLNDGGQISTLASAGGDAGRLVMRAQIIEVSGRSERQIGPSIVSTSASFGSSGNAGEIDIETNTLLVNDGAWISSSSFGTGDAGDLSIVAQESIAVIGAIPAEGLAPRISKIFASVEPATFQSNSTIGTDMVGNPSQVSIITPVLTLDHYGQILTQSLTRTSGGDITLDVSDRLRIAGGGNVIIDTINGGGTLTINSPEGTIEILGTDATGALPSGVFNQIKDDGLDGAVAGDLRIDADRLIIRDGGAISVDTFGAGRAGQLEINVRELEVSGRSSIDLSIFEPATANVGELDVSPVRVTIGDEEFLPSRISGFTAGAGAGGNLTIRGDRLVVRDFATIDSSSTRLEDLLNPNADLSPAGNITLQFDRIELDDRANIFANTLSGDSGNIAINTADLWLDRASTITTNATGQSTGGNIRINTETLVALQNSDITANAEADFGGQVNIRATGIFGAESRDLGSELTSDITATSALGPQFNGTVILETPDLRADEGVSAPVALAEAPLRQTACDTQPGDRPSEFIFTGRGGLPPRATQHLMFDLDALFTAAELVDVAAGEIAPVNLAAEQAKRDRIERIEILEIEEAQGLSRSPQGSIALYAALPPQPITCSW